LKFPPNITFLPFPPVVPPGVIESGFVRGVERWKAQEWTGRNLPVSYNAAARILEISNRNTEKIYFLAPGEFPPVYRRLYLIDPLTPSNSLTVYYRSLPGRPKSYVQPAPPLPTADRRAPGPGQY